MRSFCISYNQFWRSIWFLAYIDYLHICIDKTMMMSEGKGGHEAPVVHWLPGSHDGDDAPLSGQADWGDVVLLQRGF